MEGDSLILFGQTIIERKNKLSHICSITVVTKFDYANQ